MQQLPQLWQDWPTAWKLELLRKVQNLARQARVQRGKTDLEFFAQYYFPHIFRDETPEFHFELDALVTEAQEARARGEKKGLIIAAPRGFAKSTRITFLHLIHALCYQKKRLAVIVSNRATAAEQFLVDIRKEIEENERLQEDFGNLRGDLYGERWTNTDVVVVHCKRDEDGRPVLSPRGKPVVAWRTRVTVRGTGTQLRGMKYRSYRPDLAILDDVENDDHVITEDARAKTWAWFNAVVVPMLDPVDGDLIVVGTILHYDSLLAKLLNPKAEHAPVYIQKIYRAVKDDGLSLWPTRYPIEKLRQLRVQIGTLKYNQEYMNQPIDETTQIFPPKWWRFYTRQDLEIKNNKWYFKGELLEIFQGVDPAIEETASAHYFAHLTIGVTKSKNIVILWPYAGKIDFPKQVRLIIEQANAWRPRKIGIEKQGYQKALAQGVTMLAKAVLPVKRLSNTGAKFTRITALSVYFENGQVWIKGDPNTRQPDPYFQQFYDEAVQYPNSPADDLLDAFENAIQCASGGKKAFEEWF
jgi:predicted phage terminase large subunit-like protein